MILRNYSRTQWFADWNPSFLILGEDSTVSSQAKRCYICLCFLLSPHYIVLFLYVCTDIAKDLALWEEGRLSRNIGSSQTNLVALDHQGNFKVTSGQDSGPQVPSFTGKDIHLQLQKNKSPPLSSDNRLQVSSVTNSRPQSPNTQTTRSLVLPAPANRSATPNTLLQRPLSPSNQGNKEGIISMQRSRSLISKNQLGRTFSTPSGFLETSGDALGNVTQRSSLSEVSYF